MAIRRSAAAETQELVDSLAAGDAVARETAAARLCAIGARAVPHLIDAFGASHATVARTAILHVLETIRDRRALALGLDVLADPDRDPSTAAAAIGLLGTFLDGESTHALETLGAVAVDADRPDLERLAAWQMLERMPGRILAPLRTRLARDRNPAVRRRVLAQPAAGAAPLPLVDPADLLTAAAAGQPTDPALLRAAVPSAGLRVPLTTLHRLVERIRSNEHDAGNQADRHEWLTARAAVHAALAARRSRVALYDVKDTLQQAQGPLPAAFATALARVGDAACLEVIAGALARMPGEPTPQEHEWRDQLLEAGRAILDHERLTRRHAVVRRLARMHPEVAQALFG
ncbi:MAG: hypothetical protein Q7V01_00665 [Vicinamibacterales bacterium]|nr:hypothetical protein [Vicinamibacterales bacterium]